jgi:hypothetical protein
VRREAQRVDEKLARMRSRLADLEDGGAPDRPIEVIASSQIEIRAEAMECPICSGSLKVQEHEADTIGGRRLRLVDVKCRHCGTPRRLYFEIVGRTVN